MEVISFFESREYKDKVAHFAAIVRIMTTDGPINTEEGKIIKRFSEKMGVRYEDYARILENPKKYTRDLLQNRDEKLESIFQLFKTIYKHHYMNTHEQQLMIRYAMWLGYSQEKAKKLIDNSVRLFMGRLHLKEYLRLTRF
jgi:uncharacterized protein YpiB (UPF0302 family)